ncbi:MAG: GFA family protein [Proteobacteria bacterium]|nr:GFA family protein [Pseudomonadota bacterium]
MHKGSCLCGAVRFEVAGDLPAPDACHCTQCRKSSGHYFVSSDVARAAVAIHDGDNISWYRSSEKVRRGFCKTCGSSLFWDPIERDWIGIAMGAFDTPTNTHIHVHVYAGEKGDYYGIADDAPRYETVPPRPQQSQ